jgi:hypothetical protein
MPSIEFRSISKTYADGAPAVRDLDMSIRDGEFLCAFSALRDAASRLPCGCWLVSSG